MVLGEGAKWRPGRAVKSISQGIYGQRSVDKQGLVSSTWTSISTHGDYLPLSGTKPSNHPLLRASKQPWGHEEVTGESGTSKEYALPHFRTSSVGFIISEHIFV
jgi:hypothetical protein